MVYVDRPVEIPIPYLERLDPRLTADCEPKTDLPMTGPLPVKDALDRGAAAEDALAFCRGQLAEIRGK